MPDSSSIGGGAASHPAARAAASLRLLWWKAGARLAALALVSLALAPCSYAAIGIYNWYPEPADPYGIIHYRLNTDASSGSIVIRNASGAAVRTIVLTGPDLTKGPHQVTWFGDQDSGGIAPTGDYHADIAVSAPPVAAGSARRDFANIRGKYYGIAVDTNPANNNQLDPELSTYGMVMACAAATGKIEIFYPDQWQTGLPSGSQAPPARTIDFGQALAGAQIWGVAVGGDGRIGTMVRQYSPLQGFHNASLDGSSLQFGPQATSAQDIAAFGSASEGTGYQLRSSGSSVQMAKLQPDFSYFDYQPADASRVAEVVVQNAGAQVFGMAAGPSGGSHPPLWLTTFGLEQSVRRWTWNGSAYAADPSWSLQTHPKSPGNTAVGVDINPLNTGLMAVGCQRAADNIVLLNALSGTYISSLNAAPSMVRSVRFDPAGNLVFDGGGASRFVAQSLVSTIFLPDSGSADTRTTISFRHTKNNLPPQVLQMSFAPPSVPGDGSGTTTLEVRLMDPNGIRDVDTVVADLSALGYQGLTPMVQQQVVDLQTAVYRLANIRASTTATIGPASVTVRVRDFYGTQAASSAQVTVTGAIVSGLVTHEQLGTAVGGAEVRFVESTSGKLYSIYTTASGPDAGKYSIQISPGTYVASARKPGYGSGGDTVGVTVSQGQTLPDINPTLSSMTSAEFRAAPADSFVSVTGVVAARPADEDWASGGGKGLSDNTVPGRLRKWIVYDGPEVALPPAGIKISDDSHKVPINDKVVVEGMKRSAPGIEPYLEQLTAVHLLGPAAAPEPELRDLASLDRGGNIEPSPDWGRLVRVEQAEVVPDSQVDPGGPYFEYSITDPTSSVPWTVRVWKSLGVAFKDLPGDGVEMPVRGFVAPGSYFQTNVIEPATPDQVVQPYIDVATVGMLRVLKDLTRVTLTEPHFVTIVLPAESSYFIESPDMVAAVRVEASGPMPQVGQLVKVSGQLKSNEKSERVIGNSSYTIHGAAHARPWNMGVKALGGAGYESSPGFAYPVGLSTHGLLVRVHGKITKSSPSEKLIVVDDGSALDSGAGVTGVKVTEPGVFPAVGALVSVVGVVDSEPGSPGKTRVLRGRAGTNPDPSYSDVVTLVP